MTDLDNFQLQDFSNDYRLKSLFRMIPTNNAWSVLDIGSGNGVIAEFMAEKFRKMTLSDYSSSIVDNLKEKFSGHSNINVLKINAESFSTDEKFEMITATDIIEHLEDDLSCLHSCREALCGGGVLFISVPAIQFLYGTRDKKYGHYRRYNRGNLRKKLKEAGFAVKKLRYWNITGVLPYLISEKIFKKELVGPSRSVQSAKDKILNRFIYGILRVESFISFLPMGLSLIAVAEKRG